MSNKCFRQASAGQALWDFQFGPFWSLYCNLCDLFKLQLDPSHAKDAQLAHRPRSKANIWESGKLHP